MLQLYSSLKNILKVTFLAFSSTANYHKKIVFFLTFLSFFTLESFCSEASFFLPVLTQLLGQKNDSTIPAILSHSTNERFQFPFEELDLSFWFL